MDCVARRTRSRETLRLAMQSTSRSRRTAAPAGGGGNGRDAIRTEDSPGIGGDSSLRPELLIILDDDDEEDEDRGKQDVAADVSAAARAPSRPSGSWKQEVSSSQSSDWKAVERESNYEEGGGGSVEELESSKSGSNEEKAVSASWGTSESAIGESRAQRCYEEACKDYYEDGGDEDTLKTDEVMKEVEIRVALGVQEVEHQEVGSERKEMEEVDDGSEGKNGEEETHELENGEAQEEFCDSDQDKEMQEEKCGEGTEGKERGGETQEFDNGEVRAEACDSDQGKEMEEEDDDEHTEGREREGETQDFDNGEVRLEACDSDQDKEVEEIAGGDECRQAGKAKNLVVSSCVAWRTRSYVGKQGRVSYTSYFQTISDDTEDELYKEEEEEEEDIDDESYYGSDIAEIAGSDTSTRDGWEEYQDEDISHVFKKRKFSCIDINEEADNEGPASNSTLAQQMHRSRFTLKAGTKQKLGRVYKPYWLDMNESDLVPQLGLFSFKGDEMDNSRDWVKKDRGADEMEGRVRHKGLQSWESNKRKRVQMLKRESLFKLLVDTICSDKKKLQDEPYPSNEEPFLLEQTWSQSQDVDMHPLLFSFEDEDPEPFKISENEETLDVFWSDFEFAIESKNIGTYHTDEGQEEQDNAVDVALPPQNLCSQGKHLFVLDEQIGIICKHCSFVNLEIRYVLPSLVTSIGEKSAWRSSTNMGTTLKYDDLCRTENNGEQGYCSHLIGTVWDLIPGIFDTMYEHQREAFEFMWTNLAGGIKLDDLKNGVRDDVVGGCVISHAPGTGKTRLAIVFIQTYLKVFPECRPIIIAPSGMLLTWAQEFKKWNINLPFHILNYGEYFGKEDSAIHKLVGKEPRTEKLTRLLKLFSWDKGNGVLGISYGLFKKLTADRSKSTEDIKVRSILLEKPGLLVLDEGHTPRNERSIIWKILGKVKTEKRIILSGTPFQNNFLELYNILCLVRPKFGEKILTTTRRVYGRKADSISEEQDIFPEKYEGKGIWATITSRVTDDNVEEVRSILKPFVHIHNGKILQTLPGLRECVIVLNPLPQQKDIIKKMENIGSGNNFESEYNISLASIHPSLVTFINLSEEESKLIDKHLLENIRTNPYEGVKTRFVMEVVRLCEALKEKVLIFSQFIQPLSMIKDQLVKLFNWSEGKEILQMDGKILPKYRQASIDVFNDMDSEAKVLLASTRACCEGISLTGASRIVLLDVVWNPAVGRQAISRAYRIGQKKFVYTYNLITAGTGEREKYDRQAEKDHLSKLLFSPEIDFNNVKNTLLQAEQEHTSELISEDKILEEMISHGQLKDLFTKIYYPPTESNIVCTYNQIAPEFN
ncbi:SNF2 domain-containing protein CLASSY 4-like [Typha angustifolia]|uniref:SNF2 domain-containing protein CLASSY 4-like n=1 Tax=Typha angustifolia TaxID=59011 RepID=UPI003C300333